VYVVARADPNNPGTIFQISPRFPSDVHEPFRFIVDPVEIEAAQDGSLYVVDFITDNFSLIRITPDRHEVVATQVGGSPGPKVDVEGNVYVLSASSRGIEVITPEANRRMIFDKNGAVNRDPPAHISGNPNLTFADANPDTITRDAGDWSADGFAISDSIRISGLDEPVSCTVSSVAATVLTVSSCDLTDQGPVGGVQVKEHPGEVHFHPGEYHAVGADAAVYVTADAVDTPLWFVGSIFRVAPTCGDQELQPPEQCDDGNFSRGDGCNQACVFEPAAVKCQKAIWKATRIFATRALRVVQGCRHRSLATSSAPLDVEDCLVEAQNPRVQRIAAVTARLENLVQTTDCLRASVLGTCARGNSDCPGERPDTVGCLQKCLVNTHLEALKELVRQEYGHTDAVLDAEALRCQRNIARAGRSYALGLLKATQDCRRRRLAAGEDLGSISDCMDSDPLASHIQAAESRLRSRTQLCDPEYLRLLDPCPDLEPPLETCLETNRNRCIPDLQECLIETHRETVLGVLSQGGSR
jgi:cysteine-rich repeat protein